MCVWGGGGEDSKQHLQIQTRKFATYLCCPIKIRWCFVVVSIFPWVGLLFCFLPFDTWGQLGALKQHLRVSRQDQRSDSWHCRMIARLKSIVSNLLALY